MPPQQPTDPLTALQGAQTIGAPQIGTRYVPTEGPQSILDLFRQIVLGGMGRPAEVIAQDPYGILGWERGAGAPPMMMGTTGESSGLLDKLAAQFPRFAKALNVTKAGTLPMDETSRLARARMMGFETGETVYHGSNKRFTTFAPQPTFRNVGNAVEPTTPAAHFFSTEPETSRLYAKQRVRIDQELRGQPGGTPSVRKFYLKIQDPLDLTVTPEVRQQMIKDGYSPYYAHNPDAINPYTVTHLEEITGSSFEDWNDIQAALDDPHVIDQLRDRGFDGVRLREMQQGGDTLAVFDPAQIRSTKAGFDPRKASKGNIMYGFVPVVAGAGAAAPGAPQQQRPD